MNIAHGITRGILASAVVFVLAACGPEAAATPSSSASESGSGGGAAGTGPTATPQVADATPIAPAPSPTAVPLPSGRTFALAIAQYGVTMDAPDSLGHVSYSIATSSAGRQTDADGKTFTYDGEIDFTTAHDSEWGADCTGPDVALEVYEGDLTAAPPHFASGPASWTFANGRTYGLMGPQMACSTAPSYQPTIDALNQMLHTLRAS